MKFDTKPRGQLVYTYRVDPAWNELDALRHMNNTRYFAWCEEARIRWMRALKEPDYVSGTSPTGPVVINAACTYHRQVVYPCLIDVELYACDPGYSSFVTYYNICNRETGMLHATGAAKVVWVDYNREQSIQLPDSVRRAVLGQVTVQGRETEM